MSSGNGTPRQYSISMSQFQRERLLRLHNEQELLGRSQQFLDAYLQIIGRLERDPRVFGELLYTLPALRLEIRTAAIAPLIVDYGVHEERKIVFVQGFKVM